MITVKDLHKIYGQGTMVTYALKGIDVEVKPGEFVAVMGRSGSGKSTLLHILGLLDKPSRGEIYINGHDIMKLSEEEKTFLNILENIYLPALCLGRENNYKRRAIEMLETVGLGHRLTHYPNEVSGGEQQRAAIARALINRPSILFADEPTASLDIASAKTVLELFKRLNRELQQTIVMVTHEPEDEKYVDRVIWLKDGLIAESL